MDQQTNTHTHTHTLTDTDPNTVTFAAHARRGLMSQKSEVQVLDILMKNEVRHSDMVDIMTTMQGYLRAEYPESHRVASGGDQLTCERQLGAQCHLMDGNCPTDRPQLLEPQAEDWHCLVCVQSVSGKVHVYVMCMSELSSYR